MSSQEVLLLPPFNTSISIGIVKQEKCNNKKAIIKIAKREKENLKENKRFLHNHHTSFNHKK